MEGRAGTQQSFSESFSEPHLNTLERAIKGCGSRAPPGWLPSPSQSSGKAQLSHMHFMFSCGKIPLGGLRVKESQQVFMEALKRSLGVLLCC